MVIYAERVIVLASQSSGRLATLRAAGVEPLVHVSGVDEPAVLAELAARHEADGAPAPTPAQQVAVLAHAKAHDVACHLTAAERWDGWAVVGCDSMLEFDGAVMGKPADAAQARERWMAMRGHSGVLHTGHHVVAVDSPARPMPARAAGASQPGEPRAQAACASGVSSTVVHFGQVSEEEIDAYVATGEPLWCAGAFTIDNLGGAFIDGVEGDPHGVVGISLPLLRGLLAELGIRWTDLWGVAAPGQAAATAHPGTAGPRA